MITRIALLVTVGSLSLLAQAPGMFPWWDSPIARDLNLSEEQNQKIRSTVRETRGNLIQLRANLETAEADMGDLMNDDPVDPAKANEAIERVIQARSELARSVSQMSLKLRLILTAKQWQDLQKRQPQMPGMGRPGGPSFHGRPMQPGGMRPGQPGLPRPEPQRREPPQPQF